MGCPACPRDGGLPGVTSADFRVDPLHEAPTVAKIGALVIVAAPDIAYPARRVPPQAVAIMPIEPPKSVVANVLAHLAAAIIRTRIAPGRLPPPVVIEIDATSAVLAPTGALP